MKIQFNQVLKGLDGEDLQEGTPESKKDITLKSICTNALLSAIQGEKATGDDKVERYVLAMRIYNNDEVELKIEELALLKERVGKLYFALIVGQVFELLEGKEDE